MPDTLSVLVVDDDPRHRELYQNILADAGFQVLHALDGNEGVAILEKESVAMVVSDICMPGMDGISFLKQVRKSGNTIPFLLVTAYPAVRDAVAALKLGAVDYLEKPIDLDELLVAVRENLNLPSSPLLVNIPSEALKEVVAMSNPMLQLLQQSYQVAKSETNILLTGESGTGKEVLASFIHRNSNRSSRPLIPINCAAIPGNLIAAELFGHTKGAFTGANHERKGRFREADGGTLFLDEIGDMPADLQPSLLRVLETGKISPVGSDREHSVDVRVVAATNKDLQTEVEERRFREDLYYRLNIIAFNIPPLRERVDDILPLAKYFLKKSGTPKRFSPVAEQILCAYSWPGNVRELANISQRCAILTPSEVILPEHLPTGLIRVTPPTPSANRTKTMEEAERQAINDALKATKGNRTKAADLLGISRRNIVYKIKKYEIDVSNLP
ncbi:MAG: sigma-54-dependent Fis family transcriptional regulator [Planctomycetes bacterium]|nr:sigma-54-dependent Fis family transcriptional regulator [Planctomycetota bacterium]